MKKAAKLVKRLYGIKHSLALNAIARHQGFKDFREAIEHRSVTFNKPSESK
tara:strand:- start:1056 stop:1208 length:153 start_codon:yes stop_codon:yes gene_type:complete